MPGLGQTLPIPTSGASEKVLMVGLQKTAWLIEVPLSTNSRKDSQSSKVSITLVSILLSSSKLLRVIHCIESLYEVLGVRDDKSDVIWPANEEGLELLIFTLSH